MGKDGEIFCCTEQDIYIYIEMYIKIQTHLNLPLYVLRVLKCDINAAR